MSETPSVIGRYEVDRQLGEGGMGVLYLARDPLLDRHVALKLLRVDSVDLRRRFVREAQSAARLQHPNIVTVYDVGDHDGQLYIAMEYIDGDTLATLIRDNVPFSHIRKLDIIDEVAEGLGFAHQRGIIHRDIKPANLMMTRAGLVKVLDFGIARVAHKQSGEIDAPTLVGTPAYMAPEQLEGLVTADARSDIYAVGLVMYELFARRRAFSAPTTADVLQLVLEGRPTPLTTLVPDIDAELARIVSRAMARNPEDRYPDLQAVRKDLARARRRAMQASSDEATIVVGIPALGGVHVVAPPAAPPAPPPPATTHGGPSPSAPPTGTAPPAAVPLPPVTEPPASQVSKPPSPSTASQSTAPAPLQAVQTAEDAILARLAADRTSTPRPPAPPDPDDDYEPTIVSPVPAFDPSWTARSSASSGAVPIVPATVPPADPPSVTATPNADREPDPVPEPATASTATASAAPSAPPPLPVPLPSVPAGPVPRRVGGGVTADAPVEAQGDAPRRSSPPRSASAPAAAPLAGPPVASPVGPIEAPPVVTAAAASAAPAAPMPAMSLPPAPPPGPPAGPPSGPSGASAASGPPPMRTALPQGAKRAGVPAIAIVGALIVFLGVCFLGAFFVLRAVGLFGGPSLLSRILPENDTTTTVAQDPPATDPPVQEPPTTTATEETITEPATTSIEPEVVQPPADVPEPPTTTVEPPATTSTPVTRPDSRTGPKQQPRTVQPPVVATRQPALPPAEERDAPGVTRTEQPPARQDPQVEATPEAPREEAISLVRAYIAARNTSHAGGIRRVWPTVDDVHLRRVTSSFSSPLTLSNCQVEAEGRQRAVATCQLTQQGTTGVYAQGQAVTIRRSFTFDLERQGRGWVITGLRE